MSRKRLVAICNNKKKNVCAIQTSDWLHRYYVNYKAIIIGTGYKKFLHLRQSRYIN